jgi:hypothetical protein
MNAYFHLLAVGGVAGLLVFLAIICTVFVPLFRDALRSYAGNSGEPHSNPDDL